MNEQAAKAAASAIGPNAHALKLDVTDQASIDGMVADTVVASSAASTSWSTMPVSSISRRSSRLAARAIDRVFAVNVKGLLFTLQAVAKQMIAQGRGGKIINFASQAGRRGEALVAVYCASKAAVISLTQSAGLALIKHGSTSTRIAPGVVDNEHWDIVDAMFAKYENLKPGEKKRVVGAVRAVRPLWRAPTRLAGLPTFLASSDSRLHRRADLQCRRRQLDELSDEIDPHDRRNPRRDHGRPIRAMDFSNRSISSVPFPSGAPAIFIDQAAKFGQPAAMIGCVGNDDFGRVNLDRLRRDGVNVEGIRIDPEAATGSAFVRYRADGSRAFVYNIKHSASGNIVLDEAARAVLERSDHLHVMGTALFSPKHR